MRLAKRSSNLPGGMQIMVLKAVGVNSVKSLQLTAITQGALVITSENATE